MYPWAERSDMTTDEDRVSVQTYVTESQRDRWREEAADLDMSQAEYVRTMVQAGRRDFDLYTGNEGLNTGAEDPVEAGMEGATPGVGSLNSRVLDVLRESEFAGWDELLAGVTEKIEAQLEETLDELQSEDRIRYSGRHGGYTVVDDERR